MEDPILAVDYDADWPLLYEQKKATFSMPLAIPLRISSILAVPPYQD
jgi:hypothetical protein